jgi:hypothetical protein
MQYQKTLAASQTYTDTLSNIKGLVSDIYLSFRQTPMTGSNPRTYYNVQTYDLLDSGGITIIGDQIKSDFDRFIYWPEKFDSKSSTYMPIYNYSFAQDIESVIDSSNMLGMYYFTGYEQLRYVTDSPVTAPVITVTPNANPTAGSWRISWTDPLTNDTEVTPALAFNETAANIQSALQNLPNFRGTVTVSNPLSAGAVTFTFGGAYLICADQIKASNLQVLEVSLSPTVSVVSALTTPGVRGFTGSSYQVNILARTFASLKVKTDGSIVIANTY